MSNTLRRKMFSLGGEASKSHGVGLTSRLKYNKGGNVAPVGSNVYPKVMGPDGQMREGHNLGMIKSIGSGILGMVAPGARQLYNAVRGGGIKGIDKYIRGNSRTYGPDKVLSTSRLTGSSGGTRELITGVGRGAKEALTKKAMLGRLARGVGIGTVPIGGPLAAGALLNTDENSMRALQMLETGGKFAADISPIGLGYMACGSTGI